MKIGDVYARENVLKDFSSADNTQVGESKEVYTFRLLAVEDVQVPYGQFQDCLKTLAEWQTYDENGK